MLSLVINAAPDAPAIYGNVITYIQVLPHLNSLADFNLKSCINPHVSPCLSTEFASSAFNRLVGVKPNNCFSSLVYTCLSSLCSFIFCFLTRTTFFTLLSLNSFSSNLTIIE